MIFDTTLKKDDPEKIRELVAQVKVFNEIEVQTAQELVEEALLDPAAYSFIFARENDRIVGYTCFSEIPLTNKRYDLYWIAVAKDQQGKGLSSQLIHMTEQKVKEEGGKALYAETSGTSDYEAARHFYFKVGYTEVARLKDFYRDGDDKVIYGKFLQ